MEQGLRLSWRVSKLSAETADGPGAPVLRLAAGSGGASWEDAVALFVLILVGVVVGQTWLDWRDSLKKWRIPDWAKGTGLAGVVAAPAP